MNIFRAGKKVSLRNVTKNVAQLENAATQEGMLAITGKEPITELLRNFKIKLKNLKAAELDELDYRRGERERERERGKERKGRRLCNVN